MEQQRYLIDSNAMIDYLGGKLPVAGAEFMNSVVDTTPVLSIITKIEVLGYPVPGEHEQSLVGFINDSIVLPLNNEIADKCIGIRKVQKIKLPDAIIAATALINNLTLITRNTADFQNIDGLQIIDPHKI
jgi:hypothetical protein